VAGGGRGHAESRVRVEVVRPDESPGELAREVVLLGRELTGGIHRHGVGTVGGDDLAQPHGGEAQRELQGNPATLTVAPAAYLGVEQAVRGPEGRRQVDRLGAHVAEVGRVVGVTLHARDRSVLDAYQQAATDTAVGTER